ncbi:MAG: exopolysaccharide biosynthesis polyprenyl glycosylphosphotransferase [Henriciella sp.]|nr:exopolysaccharide biosynthesis polyprenyl glycosylphosphotransferase [Henriciella sp.]
MPHGFADTSASRSSAASSARRLPAAPGLITTSEFDTAAAKFKKRPTQITVGMLRHASRWIDAAILILLSAYFLIQSAEAFLDATLAQTFPFLVMPVLTFWGLRLACAYDFEYSRSIVAQIVLTAVGAGIPLGLIVFGTSMLYSTPIVNWVTIAAAASFVSILILHAHALAGFRHITRKGWLSENVVIVGATPNAEHLILENAMTRELNIVGIFDDRLSRAPKSISGAPILGRLDDMLTWDRLPDVDRIIVTITSDARSRVKDLIDRLRVLPQRVVLLLDLDGFDPESQTLGEIAHSPAAYVSGTPRDFRRVAVKRVSDIVFASLLLVLTSPVFLITAILIKTTGKGPIFFRQRRHGFNNQIIRVWKFRSMIDDPDAADKIASQTVADDPRVTPIGRFIRQTSIDELPQLLNVLKGEMSIVGPRPHAVGMTSEETSVHSIVQDYAHRHRVKPGITGWAQINGSRGPALTKASVRERVRLDMEYINRSSFWLDVYIMLMTAPCLLGDAKKAR